MEIITMLLPNELDYLARQEQRKDYLRKREQERLVKQIERQKEAKADVHRQAIGWLGNQMVKVGSSLERYGSRSSSKVSVLKAR
jgi:hypothetical protein